MEIINDFKKLTMGCLLTSGLKTLHYYFGEHLKFIANRYGQNIYEWYYSKRDKEYIRKFIRNSKHKTIREKINCAFQLYGGSGSMTPMLPKAAIHVYDNLKPKHIVDPFAGWGSRCLGAMAKGIDYTGYDTNTNLAMAYDWMLHDLQDYTFSNVQIYFENSETADITTLKPYDCVFTSPPYWYKKANTPQEIYPHFQYTTKCEWDSSYKNIIQRLWNGLDTHGHMCLNIPQDMLELTREAIGEPEDYTMDLLTRSKRRSKNKDLIYVWIKM